MPAEDLALLQTTIGIEFRDVSLLRRALTHRSYCNENPNVAWGDNERLEFLGDAVVDFLAAEYLYQHFPESAEGELTSLRAQLVCTETLAQFAARFQLGSYLLMGRGEERSKGRTRPTMLADAFEALSGALFLDSGLAAVRQFFVPILDSCVIDNGKRIVRDAKTRLQEWAQASLHVTPVYAAVSEQGPDHAKVFPAAVLVVGEEHGRGFGSNKQSPEQVAAEAALSALQVG